MHFFVRREFGIQIAANLGPISHEHDDSERRTCNGAQGCGKEFALRTGGIAVAFAGDDWDGVVFISGGVVGGIISAIDESLGCFQPEGGGG